MNHAGGIRLWLMLVAVLVSACATDVETVVEEVSEDLSVLEEVGVPDDPERASSGVHDWGTAEEIGGASAMGTDRLAVVYVWVGSSTCRVEPEEVTIQGSTATVKTSPPPTGDEDCTADNTVNAWRVIADIAAKEIESVEARTP